MSANLCCRRSTTLTQKFHSNHQNVNLCSDIKLVNLFCEKINSERKPKWRRKHQKKHQTGKFHAKNKVTRNLTNIRLYCTWFTIFSPRLSSLFVDARDSGKCLQTVSTWRMWWRLKRRNNHKEHYLFAISLFDYAGSLFMGSLPVCYLMSFMQL